MEWDTREVSDRLQIAELLATYTHAIDSRDFDLVAWCFTEDATLDYTASGGPRARRHEAVAWLAEGLSAIAFTQHYVTNQRITLDGDSATSHAYFLHPLSIPGRPEPVLMGGTYLDQLRRTDEGWRITERVQGLTWVQGVDPATLGVTIDGA
jgi:ketosteroid isomerase-like protein